MAVLTVFAESRWKAITTATQARSRLAARVARPTCTRPTPCSCKHPLGHRRPGALALRLPRLARRRRRRASASSRRASTRFDGVASRSTTGCARACSHERGPEGLEAALRGPAARSPTPRPCSTPTRPTPPRSSPSSTAACAGPSAALAAYGRAIGALRGGRRDGRPARRPRRHAPPSRSPAPRAPASLYQLGDDDRRPRGRSSRRFARRPATAGTRDGIGVTPGETAQMLCARLKTGEQGRARPRRLEAALRAIDPELLAPRPRVASEPVLPRPPAPARPPEARPVPDRSAAPVPTSPRASRAESAFLQDVRREVERVIVGQQALLDGLLIGPARRRPRAARGRCRGSRSRSRSQSLARRVGGTFRRIQFTPDLLPGDLVGTQVYDREDGRVDRARGPGVRQLRAGRRDQPRAGQGAVGAARGHAGAAGDAGGRDARAARRRSSCSRRRTRSSTRAPIRCPRRRSTASCSRSSSATRPRRRSRRSSRAWRARRTRPTRAARWRSPEQVLAARALLDEVYVDEKVLAYVVDLVFATREPGAGRASPSSKPLHPLRRVAARVDRARARRARARLPRRPRLRHAARRQGGRHGRAAPPRAHDLRGRGRGPHVAWT